MTEQKTDPCCVLCQVVQGGCETLLKTSLDLAMAAAEADQPKPGTRSPKQVEAIERMHILGKVVGWAFGEVLKDTDHAGLMELITLELKEHGVIAVAHDHGPFIPDGGRTH